MDVDPNNVLHTSPERFGPVENIFIKRYPTARVPTDTIAIAASPLIFVFCPLLNKMIALIIVIGKIMTILFVTLSIVAIAIAPNATCDNPSPIKENRFNTSVTPINDEHNAISVPTINAYHTKGYWK